MIKRKYTRHEKPVVEEKKPAPTPAPEPEPEPIKPVPDPLCDCGKPANPGSNQCWGCSHRT